MSWTFLWCHSRWRPGLVSRRLKVTWTGWRFPASCACGPSCVRSQESCLLWPEVRLTESSETDVCLRVPFVTHSFSVLFSSQDCLWVKRDRWSTVERSLGRGFHRYAHWPRANEMAFFSLPVTTGSGVETYKGVWYLTAHTSVCAD